MDEELTILTNPDGSGPVVISIGVPVPSGAAPDLITSASTNGNETKSRRGNGKFSLTSHQNGSTRCCALLFLHHINPSDENFIFNANSFVYIAVFTVFLHCISCSAMIYALILINNETNCSFCSDEVKKINRDLQWCMMSQVFLQCFAFMIYILYLVFGKFNQGDDLFFACLTVAVLIMELIKMKIGYDANEQNN